MSEFSKVMDELKEVRAEVAGLTAQLAACSAVCSHERSARRDWKELLVGAALALIGGVVAKKLHLS